MSDFWLTLLLIAALIGGIAVLGVFLHFAFDHIAKTIRSCMRNLNRKPREPCLPSKKTQLASPASMRDLGLSVELGDEIRMGWYETTFSLAQPIAGIDCVWMVQGSAYLTSASRCVVIGDGQRLVILDRLLDHGVRIELPGGWFDFTVEGSIVQVVCHLRHGSTEVAQRFQIDAHVQNPQALVPAPWPGSSALLPERKPQSV